MQCGGLREHGLHSLMCLNIASQVEELFEKEQELCPLWRSYGTGKQTLKFQKARAIAVGLLSLPGACGLV